MSFKLTQYEGEFLVKLARKAIIEFLKTGRKIPIPRSIPETLTRKSGVFVTLDSLESGMPELRGCIGYPEPILQLVEATIDSAISSATGDPRFPPVLRADMDKIVIEVSILSPPQLIKVEGTREYPKKLEIGKDGLIVERDGFRGLLLPQVAVEWKWNEEDLLANCCIKAGIQPDGWLDKKAKIYTFQVIVFAETRPNGEVELVKLNS